MFSPTTPPGMMPALMPPSMGILVEMSGLCPGAPPYQLVVPVATGDPNMPFSYVHLQSALQQAQVDSNLYLSDYINRIPASTTQLASPIVTRKQPRVGKGGGPTATNPHAYQKRPRVVSQGESEMDGSSTGCPHGFPFSQIECLYSCSHWSHRKIHPNEIMAQYVRRVANSSAKNKLIIPAELEVPYGSGRNPGEKLDILGAEALPGEAPIFAFIHGGYWQEGSRQMASSMAGTLTTFGSVFVAIGYDLAPKVTLDEMVNQVVLALGFVHNMAVQRGSRGVYLCGHSAGAHLLSMALARIDPACVEYFKGAFLLSGIYDLEPLINSYIGNPIGITLENAKGLSPVQFVDTLVQKCSHMFFGFVVAECDSQSFIDNNRDFYQMVNAGNRLAKRPEFHVIQGEDHFTIVERLDEQNFSLAKLFRQWMGL